MATHTSWEIRTDNIAVALSCESVIVQGNNEIPVEVAAVDNYFKTRIHNYIRINPFTAIENFRIFNHGLPLNMLQNRGIGFDSIQNEIRELVDDKIVVGYNLPVLLHMFDLENCIPEYLQRDIKMANFFKDEEVKRVPHFEAVVQKFLGIEYRRGAGLHSVMVNADMLMKLFLKYQDRSLEDWMGFDSLSESE